MKQATPEEFIDSNLLTIAEEIVKEVNIKDGVLFKKTPEQVKNDLVNALNLKEKRASLDRALEILDNNGIVLLEPEQLLASQKLAVELSTKATPEEALEKGSSLKKMWLISDEKFESIYLIGKTLFNEKKLEDAENILSLLTILDPSYSNIWYALGIVQQAREDFFNAAFSFSSAFVLDRNQIGSGLALVDCYLCRKEPDLAKAYLEEIEQNATSEQKTLYQNQIASLKSRCQKK